MTIDNRDAPRGARYRPALSLVLITVCAVACLGCDDDPTVDVTTPCLDFIPAEGAASGNIVARKSGESSCNTLVLDLVATDIEDIYSTAFTIDYATSIASAFLLEVGPLLTGTGGSTSTECVESGDPYGVACKATGAFSQGNATISVSRQFPVWGNETARAGPEGVVLATLALEQLAFALNSNGPFGFTYASLLNADTPPLKIIDIDPDASPSPITAGTFLGGQLIIREQ